MAWYDNFSDFKGAGVDCDAGSFITGDLKLKEVLFAATFVGAIPGNMSKMYDPNGPYQNVQDTITFDVDTNANATPMWHYINVGVNTSGTFVNVDRDRKDMLLITMGPPPASSLRFTCRVKKLQLHPSDLTMSLRSTTLAVLSLLCSSAVAFGGVRARLCVGVSRSRYSE